jgi:hypothetical protein
MEALDDILLSRLTKKGITPLEVRGLIRDILNIIGPGGDFTVPMINDRLSALGWEDKVMDEYTFDLMLWFLEEIEVYEVVRQSQH